MPDYTRTGELMISKGFLSQEQLDEALKLQKLIPRRIGELLQDLGYAKDEHVAMCLSEQYDYPFLDLKNVEIDPDAVNLLDGETALKYCILPFKFLQDAVECAIGDPIDVISTDTISRILGKKLVLHISPVSQLIASIKSLYNHTPSPENELTVKPLMNKKRRPHRQRDREALLAALDKSQKTSRRQSKKSQVTEGRKSA